MKELGSSEQQCMSHDALYTSLTEPLSLRRPVLPGLSMRTNEQQKGTVHSHLPRPAGQPLYSKQGSHIGDMNVCLYNVTSWAD
jgi:hypothetical protein